MSLPIGVMKKNVKQALMQSEYRLGMARFLICIGLGCGETQCLILRRNAENFALNDSL